MLKSGLAFVPRGRLEVGLDLGILEDATNGGQRQFRAKPSSLRVASFEFLGGECAVGEVEILPGLQVVLRTHREAGNGYCCQD